MIAPAALARVAIYFAFTSCQFILYCLFKKAKGKTVRVKSEKLLEPDYYKQYESISFPARNHRGDDLLLFLGIIDILQNYRLLKKLEHTWKSVLHDGDTISVHNPTFYAQRFITFLKTHVFHATSGNAYLLDFNTFGSMRELDTGNIPIAALRQSPSKRQHLPRRSFTEKEEEISGIEDIQRRPYGSQQKPREKKVERLFAPDPEPAEARKSAESLSSDENIIVSLFVAFSFVAVIRCQVYSFGRKPPFIAHFCFAFACMIALACGTINFFLL
ncbi:unnamed protein product [Gongylonema pulchrum]|uniref:PIPK domain-containing protein n=1 Tax=Gongylonema pulchrum TaxID=637853 RepID=A0A183EEX3_9BILA|nr:unnamed protein product [Gongylonema pulchrum]